MRVRLVGVVLGRSGELVVPGRVEVTVVKDVLRDVVVRGVLTVLAVLRVGSLADGVDEHGPAPRQEVYVRPGVWLLLVGLVELDGLVMVESDCLEVVVPGLVVVESPPQFPPRQDVVGPLEGMLLVRVGRVLTVLHVNVLVDVDTVPHGPSPRHDVYVEPGMGVEVVVGGLGLVVVDEG